MVRHITEQLNLSSIDIPYNSYTALYWINKHISTLPARNSRFKACCKYSNINLPLFQPPPEYLRDLLESHNTSTKLFRERLRAYNTALAFMSVNYTITNHSVAHSGPNYFQIYSELYHLQGLLEPPTNITPQYAQLYFYDPSYAIDVQLRARPNLQLDATILRYLTDILSEVQNPFIALY